MEMDRETWARVALAASVIGGVSYMASWGLSFSPAVSLAWKGTGVGFLALYAVLSARSPDGWLLTAVMALGASGDVLLGAAGQTVGGAVFLAGHVAAIGLYLRRRRLGLGPADYGVAGAVVVIATVVAFLLPPDRGVAPGVAIYALGGASGAATAWLSRFPRGQVALGALMFLVSDELIFARMGPLAGQGWTDFAVWGLYYGGQLLIATGVARSLARAAQKNTPPGGLDPAAQ